MFVKAKKFKIFDENGKELNNYKNVANEENEQETFSIVSNAYTVIQHEDVYNTVKEAIEDKNLDAEIRPNACFNGQGGRLHIEVTFKDIALDIEDNGLKCNLYCTYDNSYDSTTGLRLSVGAKRGNSVLWINDCRYYHRHTKSVSVKNFEEKLDKGIDSFLNKIKAHFLGMYKTATTETEVLDFLENIKEAKNVSKTYVDSIVSKIKQATIKNKWQVYCIICDVITKEASSIDVRERQLTAIINGLHRAIKSTSEQVEKTEFKNPNNGNNQGVNLNQVVNSQQAPDGVLCLQLHDKGAEDTTQSLSIERKSKRKFEVKLGTTVLKTCKKYKQAQRYLKSVA